MGYLPFRIGALPTRVMQTVNGPALKPTEYVPNRAYEMHDRLIQIRVIANCKLRIRATIL